MVILAGIPPAGRSGAEVVLENACIAAHVVRALSSIERSHVVYLSSDAVYPDLPSGPGASLSERSCAAPTSAYGVSHRVRESILRESLGDRLAILRSTMIYGAGDRHDAYGPNRMARSALSERVIRLFGQGEDVRDYVACDDLVAWIVAALERRSVGVLNAASGESTSALELAECLRTLLGADVRIERQARTQPPSARCFDVAERRAAFPELEARPLRRGLAELLRELRGEEGEGLAPRYPGS